MQSMRFSRLYLLSQVERRALQVDLASPKTVLVAGNGFGKSAILKSLYDCLGAPPHKIDQSWVDAKVISLLEFSINSERYSVLKTNRTFTFFDSSRKPLLSSNRITDEVSPFLSHLLNFGLVLTDKRDQTRIPPPSYAFAPFYIDQDRSWQKPWDGFRDLAMFPGSSKNLSDYHSGLKPNGYYAAKSERDKIKSEIARLRAERDAVAHALRRIRETMPQTTLTLDLAVFKRETDSLVSEARLLQVQEEKHRALLALAHEERHAWGNQVALLETAISEQDSVFKAMLKEPRDVECPMCGQHYHNDVAQQFDLASDKDDLIFSLQIARDHLRVAEQKCDRQHGNLEDIRASILRIELIMKTEREGVSLKDVIASEGREEATRYLNERLAQLDADHGNSERRLGECELQMKAFDNPERKASIKAFFADNLALASKDLDVRLPENAAKSIQGTNIGRGSEGPRALTAYYYAFLQTARKFGSSAFCPIVVDAPNQQGQDTSHLDQIMQFLLTKMPHDSQLIVATESISKAASQEATVLQLSARKNQVLNSDEYETVSNYMNQYLSQLLLL